MVGPGKAMWNCVHVRDLAHLYITLMTAALEPDMVADSDSDVSGFYFAESGEFTWSELFKAVAVVLVGMGEIDASEKLDVFSDDELQEYMLGVVTWSIVGCNARCKAERARALGWRATQPSLFECVSADVRQALGQAG